MDEPGHLALVTFFSFRGSVDRRTFILTTLALYGVVYAAGVALCVGLLGLDVKLPTHDVPAGLASIRVPTAVAWSTVAFGTAGVAVFALGSIAISVRRLHDAGRSGFFVLLFFVFTLLLPDVAWSNFLPPLPALVWNAIMIALPQGRPRRLRRSLRDTF